MNPDKEHAKYFKKSPNGNHDRMSPETRLAIEYLQRDINHMRNDLQKDVTTVKEQFNELKDRVDNMYDFITGFKSEVLVALRENKVDTRWVKVIGGFVIAQTVGVIILLLTK